MAASTNDLLKKTGSNTVTTLSAPGKALGATSINVGSTTNYPTDTGIIIAIRQVDSSGALVAGTYTEWSATVSSATSLAIVATPVLGSDQIYAAGSTTQVYIPVSSYAQNKLIDNILEHANQDGTLITQAVRDALNLDSGSSDGWTPFGYSLTSITALGNRSYTAVVSGTDTTGVTSVGMRLKLPRTVTAPTYMGGAFNGSSHYFTKVTPTGTLSTITNNFTIMAHVEPTSYAAGYICGRADSTPNNLFTLKMESDGRVAVAVNNGGAANYRVISTYQSLPLNKKTHVAASWTSGTVVIYFDGVSVPFGSPLLGGTNPTVAGTGGDFSIGRAGAWNSTYFPGYISSVGVFDAVLTQATIRQHMNQALTGSETNCIGAWNLNNAATDATASANNLTATGGVGYTARSPYTNPVTGTSVTAGTTNYGIITAQTFSTNTTYTIQIPEGETLPTTGGIGTVSYSTQKTPYGFPQMSNRVGYVLIGVAQTGITTETAVLGATITVSAPSADTKYRITYIGHQAQSSANTQNILRLKDGSTEIRQHAYATPNATNAFVIPPLIHEFTAGTAGSHTYKMTATAPGGGSLQAYALAPYVWSEFIIEQVGLL